MFVAAVLAVAFVFTVFTFVVFVVVVFVVVVLVDTVFTWKGFIIPPVAYTDFDTTNNVATIVNTISKFLN